jgi:hypothetical protein
MGTLWHADSNSNSLFGLRFFLQFGSGLGDLPFLQTPPPLPYSKKKRDANGKRSSAITTAQHTISCTKSNISPPPTTFARALGSLLYSAPLSSLSRTRRTFPCRRQKQQQQKKKKKTKDNQKTSTATR